MAGCCQLKNGNFTLRLVNDSRGKDIVVFPVFDMLISRKERNLHEGRFEGRVRIVHLVRHSIPIAFFTEMS